MARWKRTPEETKAKVVELKIWNPELSSLDIEALLKGTDFETSHDTILRITDELRKLASSERWKKQLERLDNIIWGIEEITDNLVARLQKNHKISVSDAKHLNEIAKTNWERRRLLKWEWTEIIELKWL